MFKLSDKGTVVPPLTLDEIIQKLGLMVDKCDNYLAYKQNRRLAPELKNGAYEMGLGELRGDLKALGESLGGEDLWD